MRDPEQTKAAINALHDVESAVWAAPFFAVFASMRLVLLILTGETVTNPTARCTGRWTGDGTCIGLMWILMQVMIVAIVFNEGGLAFPAWICFALAVASIVTGFPTW